MLQKALATIQKYQGGAPSPPAGGAPGAVPAAPQGLRTAIDTSELESAITRAIGNNLGRARGDFEGFVEGWDKVKGAVQTENPAYAEITASIAAAGPRS